MWWLRVFLLLPFCPAIAESHIIATFITMRNSTFWTYYNEIIQTKKNRQSERNKTIFVLFTQRQSQHNIYTTHNYYNIRLFRFNVFLFPIPINQYSTDHSNCAKFEQHTFIFFFPQNMQHSIELPLFFFFRAAQQHSALVILHTLIGIVYGFIPNLSSRIHLNWICTCSVSNFEWTYRDWSELHTNARQ